MTKPRDELLGEIRYAERLCQRTARLYRRLQVFGTFMTVVSGSAVVASVSSHLPPEVVVSGGIGLALFGAMLVAIRPGDKAAANENDVKRYAQLRTRAADNAISDTQLEAELNKARESDAPEVEPLRDVAWNDVAVEVGAADQRVALNFTQRLLGALA